MRVGCAQLRVVAFVHVCLLCYHHRGVNNARLSLSTDYHGIVDVNERRYYADANCALP